MNINYAELLNVTLRALISLITLFLVTKMIGKKQVSQLSLFDYVIGISIGNFAAEMTINLESEEIYGIIAVLIFGLVAYIVSILTIKSITLRRFFMGTPTILIQKGKILQKNFIKVRYDINDILEQCRIKGYYDISNIEYAIVEANGELSILPKADYRPSTNIDNKNKVQNDGLCANIIIDGKLMHNNINYVNITEEKILKELKNKNIDINNILLATYDINNKIKFYEKNKKEKEIKVLE